MLFRRTQFSVMSDLLDLSCFVMSALVSLAVLTCRCYHDSFVIDFVDCVSFDHVVMSVVST